MGVSVIFLLFHSYLTKKLNTIGRVFGTSLYKVRLLYETGLVTT